MVEVQLIFRAVSKSAQIEFIRSMGTHILHLLLKLLPLNLFLLLAVRKKRFVTFSTLIFIDGNMFLFYHPHFYSHFEEIDIPTNLSVLFSSLFCNWCFSIRMCIRWKTIRAHVATYIDTFWSIKIKLKKQFGCLSIIMISHSSCAREPDSSISTFTAL